MTERSNDILLATTGLKVGYKTGGVENVLFENLNLKLEAGKLVCFMGPNGSGKSTLIRTMAGLQKPLGGSIGDNTDPVNISVVLTDKVPASSMTAYDLITYGRYPYLDWNVSLSKTDVEKIGLAIKALNISHLSDKKLYELSDGQLQMTMIARAMAQDTPIILLDEPTAHLDLNNRVEIMKFLHGLAKKSGKAILVSTHELDLALQVADIIWLAGENRNVLTGIPEDLVLNGSFDEIFKFKGFDLRSGKVEHEASRGARVQLIGTGHEFLWTKNALERNGFEVVSGPSDRTISIEKTGSVVRWRLGQSGNERILNTMEEMLNSM